MSWLVALLALSTGLVQAETHWVGPHGSDSAAGSETAPFQTPARALRQARPGDTVMLLPGDYAGQLAVSVSGTPDRPITLRAALPGTARIRGRTERLTRLEPVAGTLHSWWCAVAGPVAAVALDVPGSPLVIDALEPVRTPQEVEAGGRRWHWTPEPRQLRLRVDGYSPLAEHTVHLLRDTGGVAVSGAWVCIEGLTVAEFAGYGLHVSGHHVTIRDCRITRCGFAWQAGISLDRAEAARLEDNRIWNVMNALILSHCRDAVIDHNTLFRTRAHGVLVNGGSGGRLTNNIIYAGGKSGSALYLDATAGDRFAADHNVYLDSGTSCLIRWLPTGGEFSTFWEYRRAVPGQDLHSRCADPLFVSTVPGEEDLDLRPDSPCRKAARDGSDLGSRSR